MDGDTFTLSAASVGCLRREGVTIRNHMTVERSNAATQGCRLHVSSVRSWLAMTRAVLSAQEASLAGRRNA